MSKERVFHGMGEALLTLLVLASYAHAYTGEAAASKSLLDLLSGKALEDTGSDLVDYLGDLCRENFLTLLLMNPGPMTPAMLGVTGYITAFLEPVFVFAILASGIYLIFVSGSPQARTKVKAMLPAIVAAMILVTLSSPMLNVLFYVSKLLCTGVVSQWDGNPVDVLLPEDRNKSPTSYFMSRFVGLGMYSFDSAMPFLYLSLLLLAALFTITLARYLIVSLFAMIFPLTIFLYLFAPSRTIGKGLMEQTIIWTFLQVIEAVALLSVVSVIKASAQIFIPEVLVLLELTGIIVLIAVPVSVVLFFRDFLPG